MTAGLTRWLRSSRKSASRYLRAVELQPLAHFLGTPPQLGLWRCPSRRRLLRTGNQIGGKTTAALVEALWWATHTHPHRQTPAGPVQVWFVCVSWTQSLNIQHKLWALCPKSAMTPDTRRRYTPERGFGANAPVVTFLDGSQIWVKTGKQDALDQAGGTVHLVCYDEPPKRQRNFSELERRLTRTGGDLILTMTPVNARIDWIRDLAEAGGITDLHYPATPEMLVLSNGVTLRTETGEVMDADWLANERKKVMAWEEPVVIDGEWEMRADGAVWEAWNPGKHVVPQLMDSDVGPRGQRVRLCLGIDYGDESLRTAAVLCAVEGGDPGRGRPTRVWVLDEYVPTSGTTVEMDGDAILEMLAARGLRWSQLARVYGDKSLTDAKGRVVRKSNAKLEAHIARRLGLSGGRTVPRVGHVKRGDNRGAGSLWHSVRWIHERMLTPGGWVVDARCKGVVDALSTWDGGSKHIAKDRIDAMRYALADYWGPSKRGGRAMADRMRVE